MIQNLGQVAITVVDTETSVPFYQDTLGLKLLFRAGNMAFFDCGVVRLMLSPSEGGSQYSSILYFRTADIQEACTKLKARSVSLEREPHLLARMPDHDLWMAFFRDPSGNMLALMSEVWHATA